MRLSVKCIKDVVVKNRKGKQETAFFADKVYRAYYWLKPHGYEYQPVLCAPNELKETGRHIIKYLDNDEIDGFFNEHFEVIKPIKTNMLHSHLEQILTQLEACGFKDEQGHPLENNDAFIKLKKVSNIIQ